MEQDLPIVSDGPGEEFLKARAMLLERRQLERTKRKIEKITSSYESALYDFARSYLGIHENLDTMPAFKKAALADLCRRYSTKLVCWTLAPFIASYATLLYFNFGASTTDIVFSQTIYFILALFGGFAIFTIGDSEKFPYRTLRFCQAFKFLTAFKKLNKNLQVEDKNQEADGNEF